MTFAHREREALCALAASVGPEAPTLDEGWQVLDLVAHLYIRESDPIGMPGIFAKPLANLTKRRTDQAIQRYGFSGLIEKVASGPPTFSIFSLPGMDVRGNTTEMFIHHEDIRRAGDDPLPPRVLAKADEDALWAVTPGFAKLALHTDVGIVLQRSDTKQTYHAQRGNVIVTVVGLPSELLMYVSGRQAHSHVDLIGDEEGLRRLEQ